MLDPSELEIVWANTIIDATRKSHAVQINGIMIDRQVIERAKKILDRVTRQKTVAQ